MTTETHPAATLRAQIAGSVLSPSDAAYEDARHVHNGLIDRRPALVVRCHGTADVQAAVRFAREHRLEIAVRGGGHSGAGLASVDGGLVIDLSPMNGVEMNGTIEAASTMRRPGMSVRTTAQAMKVPKAVAISDAPPAITSVLTIAS